jgi:hypothetical protein
MGKLCFEIVARVKAGADKERFSLNVQLSDLVNSNRPGVYLNFPFFPPDFGAGKIQ